MNYLSRQIDEIQNSLALRCYGAALGFTHILTLFFWRGGATLRAHVEDPITICWSFWPNCEILRPFWQVALTPVLLGYLVCAVLGTLLWSRKVTWAYGFLLSATWLKFALYTIDYREMGNYHYMPNFVLLAFLFLPNKVEVVRFLIVGFYLAAGILKFNHEWLSGAALFGHPLLRGQWLVIGCVAAVFLEMVISLGLLSRRRTVFCFALASFTIFHLFSWHIVGYFYPLIMFALLSIFVLGPTSAKDIWDFLQGRCARSTYACLAVLALMQVPPFFAKTDPAITGEGRLTSLNMFDARIICDSHVWLTHEEKEMKTTVDMQNPLDNLGTRIRCEPAVYYEYARSLCRAARLDPRFRSMDLDLLGRRSSDQVYQVLIHARDVCH